MVRIDEIKKRIIDILNNEGFYVNDMDVNGNNIYTDESSSWNLIFDELKE